MDIVLGYGVIDALQGSPGQISDHLLLVLVGGEEGFE